MIQKQIVTKVKLTIVKHKYNVTNVNISLLFCGFIFVNYNCKHGR